jgi:hypothetical protein
MSNKEGRVEGGRTKSRESRESRESKESTESGRYKNEMGARGSRRWVQSLGVS